MFAAASVMMVVELLLGMLVLLSTITSRENMLELAELDRDGCCGAVNPPLVGTSLLEVLLPTARRCLCQEKKYKRMRERIKENPQKVTMARIGMTAVFILGGGEVIFLLLENGEGKREGDDYYYYCICC